MIIVSLIILNMIILSMIIFSDQSGEQSSGTSTSLKLPKTNGIQRSASVPSQPFTNKVGMSFVMLFFHLESNITPKLLCDSENKFQRFRVLRVLSPKIMINAKITIF